MTRVIAGARKGFKLATYKSPLLRPTTDRTKQVIFNVLSHEIPESQVLDIFAGTGGLGIEALSRGANRAVFVESHTRVCAVLIENLDKTGFQGQAQVLKFDAPAALAMLAKQGSTFDIIFADPPYEAGLAEDTLTSVARKQLLKSAGWFAIEHSSRLDLAGEIDTLFLKTRKKHGDTSISFYQNV